MTSPAYTWVDSNDQLATRLGKFLSSPQPLYSLDTEFASGYAYDPVLALVQLGLGPDILLVDPFVVDLTLLAPLFASPSLAILHAAVQDLDLLARAVGTRPTHLFDTQVAASLLGYATPALATLVRRLGVTLSKAEQRADWTKRPLKEKTLTYAADDVRYLPELYSRLDAELLKRARRDWLDSEMATLLARPLSLRVPEQAWWRIPAALSASLTHQHYYQNLCSARDTIARGENCPPTHVLSDVNVTALVRSMPNSPANLSRHPALGELSEELRVTLVNALCAPVVNFAEPPRSPNPTEERLITVLSAYATSLATRLNIDRSLLATKTDITDLLLGRPTRLMVPWRRSVLTNDLTDLIAGTKSLLFSGTDIVTGPVAHAL